MKNAIIAMTNPDDNMILSAALATAVGTLENVEGVLMNDIQFSVLWEKGLILIGIEEVAVRLTQDEALHHAALQRRAALDAGATVM